MPDASAAGSLSSAPSARSYGAPSSNGAGARLAGDDRAFAMVLGEAAGALERNQVPHAVIGGVASSGLGRQRATRDIDFLVKPEDARLALATLGGVGFHTEETDP